MAVLLRIIWIDVNVNFPNNIMDFDVVAKRLALFQIVISFDLIYSLSYITVS